MNLIDVIRKKKCTVAYDTEYNNKWSDDELLRHILKLYCTGKKLQSLPQLPNCQTLDCSANRLQSLPQLPNCKTLDCRYNQLLSLPKLLICEILDCSQNQLQSLPKLPNCQVLYCFSNQLQSLPQLPVSLRLVCYNNQLHFNDLNSFKKIWKFIRFYYGTKLIKILYKNMLNKKAKYKYDLHLELKYSPNLNFYKDDEYYKHFIYQQNLKFEI
jgi:Leucine-rich repeat (LRR) protein